jgi:hypothetical protein
MTRTNAFRFTVAVLAGFSLLGASCGDDKQSADTVAVAATVETHPIVDDATVTAGLAKTGEILTAAATTPDTAEADWDEAHTTWETYEGTIKQNRPDSYLAMEDALAAFETAAKAGDSPALTKAAADFETAAATYLAAFPG